MRSRRLGCSNYRLESRQESYVALESTGSQSVEERWGDPRWKEFGEGDGDER